MKKLMPSKKHFFVTFQWHSLNVLTKDYLLLIYLFYFEHIL
nr:MAG TPA: hypothetical protein [Caudoviricetes sp.]